MSELICFIIAVTQLFLIHKLVKTSTFYGAILHLFLVYPTLALQIIPYSIRIFNEHAIEQFSTGLIMATAINFFYIVSCLLVWKSFSVYSDGHTEAIFKNYSLFWSSIIVLQSIVYNIAKVSDYLNIISTDLTVILFPINTFLLNIFKVVPFYFLYRIYRKQDKCNFIFKSLVILSVIVYFLSIIPTGHRSSLLLPGAFVLFYCLPLKLGYKMIYASVAILSFSFVSNYYKLLRFTLHPEEAVRNQYLANTTFLEEVFYRLSVYSEVSAGILVMVWSSVPVGFQPLWTSLTAGVPKGLLSMEKLWPGSIDGTEFGILAKVAHEYTFGQGWNMSEYMYPLHPVWELGWSFYIINILVVPFLIIVLEKISAGIKGPGLLLVTSTMLPFTYSYTFPPLAMLLQQLGYVFIPGVGVLVLYAVLANALSFLVRKKKYV